MIPTVVRCPASPAIPSSQGLAITLDPRRDPAGPLVVHGAFHLAMADGDAIGHPVHRGIVVVVWSIHHCYAIAPFREHVLFADDEASVPGGVGGYFNVDPFATEGGPVQGDFHVYASLGDHLSNVVRASAR